MYARIAQVSLRQLQWWDERKVVSPRHEGHKRIYLAEEVIEITVIAELRRKGFSLQKIRRVLRFLQREMGKPPGEVMEIRSDLHLVTDGKSIFLEDQQDRIIDILKNARQPMFLVCVSDQVRRLADVERSRSAWNGAAASAARRAVRSASDHLTFASARADRDRRRQRVRWSRPRRATTTANNACRRNRTPAEGNPSTLVNVYKADILVQVEVLRCRLAAGSFSFCSAHEHGVAILAPNF